MRNAIALLTLPDSESALVYALVHDPEFRLAAALTSNAQRLVDVTVVRALLQVFDGYEDQLRRFVSLLMLKEMIDTLNWNELFRANSTTTAIIREYTCDLGADFLQAAFQDALAEIWDSEVAYEVNPLQLAPGQDLEANQQKLAELAAKLLDRIFEAAPLFPYQVAKIYRAMETEMARLIDRDRRSAVRLSTIGEDASSRISEERKSAASSLPRLSAISEEMLFDDLFVPRSSLSSGGSNSNSSGLSAAKEEFYVHLGGFLFLRFLCPALILPHRMGLTPDDQPPSKPLQRTLVLVAKLFQSLANNVEYGQREEYMVPFNAFLQNHRARLFKFYDQICQQAVNDNRRESLILKSNLTPRISQLWGASNVGRGSMGLITGPPRVASVDDSLSVLQKWMHENLDAITKAVATNGKQQKRKSFQSGGDSSTSKASACGSGTMSPVSKKQKEGAKRLLKSAKNLSPLMANSDESSPSDNDEDEDAKGASDSDGEPVVPANVTKEELERMMGLTSHRDIQLMKIYYANLAQSGLQRLLRSVDGENASQWTLYRSRNAVDVFKREDPNTSTPACGLSMSGNGDRYVEMKASVEVNATPRQVFKYLRSLDKMIEWDDHVTRKVEPLDDSKVVLYRAQPKLSLWPTWLVKPRDSCDLHSFVEKTGRPDTYAVLMESVPRPDVPTRKGTVRMAFATGGFLVEPSVVSETHGQTAKLTGIVKADFKGTLPRYLAESICFRQVLSVRVIKLRLETAKQHGNSSWV